MSARENRSKFWSNLLCSSTLRNGLVDGLLLTSVMSASLFAANRVPLMERWALERNSVSYGAFFLVAILPVVRYSRSPRCLFVSGMTAWTIFSLGYLAAGMYFSQLFSVLRTPFEVFVDGALGYGVAAVLVWVASMFSALRHTSPAPTRRRHTDLHP